MSYGGRDTPPMETVDVRRTIGGMNTSSSTAATLAAVLLGITAAGAILFGIVVPVAVLGSSWGNDAVGPVIVAVGAASVAFGLLSAFAAFAVATGRASGALIGLVVGGITLLGTAVASVTGGFQAPMAAGFILGGAVVSALVAAGLGRPSEVADTFPW
jgi:hypothetical protein